MKKMFYSRLALGNIRKNSMIYIPYLLTGICTVMLYYIITSLSVKPQLLETAGGTNLVPLLQTGSSLTGFFAFLFLLYTNSFLIKRRKKEIGLYNILGMEKKHIGRVMAWESLFTAGSGILGGILLGILLEKLVFVILMRLLSFPVTFGFSVSGKAVTDTAGLFCVVYLLCLIGNLISVWRAKPIELLHGGQIGEREPKTKWILALIGVITLGIGYGIALFAKNPISALALFFLAVIMVMIGTHCLFTAGSIVVLKLLRKNKKYYYKPNHFISVSGMIYRMKQNAAGLANICILSCAVLVSVSTTLSLYVGEEEILRTRYPKEIVLTRTASEIFMQGEEAEGKIREAIKQMGLEVTELERYQGLSFSATETEEGIFEAADITNVTEMKYIILDISVVKDYNRLAGTEVSLGENEILLYGTGKPLTGEIKLLGDSYRIAGGVDEAVLPKDGTLDMGIETYFCVVNSEETLQKIFRQQYEAYEGRNRTSDIRYYFMFDMTGTQEDKIQAANLAAGAVSEYGGSLYAESRDGNRMSFYQTYGSMLFLGVFLGLVFAMATVLIIYYKQITEGLEDRERFVIMQKVGMSFEEVRKTISSQVLTVFYLPLITAGIHLAVAFPVICKLLLMFGLVNKMLFAGCLIGCILVFALFYGIVYALTARVYYKIVKGIAR